MTLHIVPTKCYYITVRYCHLCPFPSSITSHLAYKLTGIQTTFLSHACTALSIMVPSTLTRGSGELLCDSASGALHPVFSSPVQGRHGHPQASPTEATRMTKGGRAHGHTTASEAKTGFILPEGEGWEEILPLFTTMHWKDMEKIDTEVCSNSTKAMGNTRHRKFWLDIRIFFFLPTMSVLKHWHVNQRRWGIAIPRDIQILPE